MTELHEDREPMIDEQENEEMTKDFAAQSQEERQKPDAIPDREDEAQWYVVHTYSGHENKVKANIEKIVANRGKIADIYDVMVPMEEYLDEKDGVERLKERKMFPGYVLVKMIINDDSWYVVRNTRGVTGFVGSGNKPIPLSPEEASSLGVKEEPKYEVDYEVNEQVRVVKGAFIDLVARIEELDYDKRKMKAYISMFGRETLVELNYDQVTKM